MTITESDLREFLESDSGGGPRGGVTVADVDRRVRRIRRRRLGAAGGAAALGLAVAAALTLPAGPAGTAPGDDVWTGAMSRPDGSPRVVATPLGDPIPKETLLERRFTAGGAREEVTVPTGGAQISVSLWCSGPVAKAALWIDGRLVTAGPCGQGIGERVPMGTDVMENPYYVVRWTAPPDDHHPIEHTVAAALLKPADTSGGRAAPEEMTGTEDVEERLAEGGRFDAGWRLVVERMGGPECRDGARQVDPATGEVVVLDCANPPAAPSAAP
ncbi:hypothetical protein ACFOWE_33330 [Planomonospora corallina]|uniref:Uncharacterized protein n=1 Tax=Planomonospora corallina TaxID=1806052 RepID=A0ABV8IJL5_9ACTN